MEIEEIQAQPCKFPRMANGTTGKTPNSAAKVAHKMGLSELHYPKDADDSQQKKSSRTAGAGAVVGIDESNRLRGWQHHSRIVRVSRASGGKDRHSKVLTSKGLRDRRVRLSVPTAIQFYDIQDRLGYDQPSKAVEWLIKVAADSISELPSLNGYFGGNPAGQQLSDGKRTSEENATDQNAFDSADFEMDGDNDPSSQYGQQNQNLSLSKSACSSTSETSKGSGGLSLSRSELRNNRVRAHNRVRARERARERTAKEKNESSGNQQQPLNLISQSASFTELLTGGIGMSNGVNTTTTSSSPSGSGHQNPSNSARTWSSVDYFTGGLLSTSLARNSSGFVGQLQMANNQITQALPILPFTISNGSDGGSHHELPQPHHFPFVPEGYIPTATPASSTGIENNLNFTISSSSASPASGLDGFNRGTLQSNSSSQLSLLSNLQRFSTIDGSSSPHHQNINGPFFIGTAVPLDSHHHHHHHGQFLPALDGRLHLHYGHNEKEKPKN